MGLDIQPKYMSWKYEKKTEKTCNCCSHCISNKKCEIWGMIKDNDRAKVCTTFLRKAETKGE